MAMRTEFERLWAVRFSAGGRAEILMALTFEGGSARTTSPWSEAMASLATRGQLPLIFEKFETGSSLQQSLHTFVAAMCSAIVSPAPAGSI